MSNRDMQQLMETLNTNMMKMDAVLAKLPNNMQCETCGDWYEAGNNDLTLTPRGLMCPRCFEGWSTFEGSQYEI